MAKNFGRIGSLTLILVGVLVIDAFGGIWDRREIIRGSGIEGSETRNISGATEIELATIGELTIEIGDRDELTIEADDNLLEHFITDVTRGRLRITTSDGVSLRTRRPVRFTVVIKRLEAIAITSSGDVLVVSDLNAVDFEIFSISSGDLEMEALHCEGDAHVELESSGDVYIRRVAAERLDARLSSSGDLEIDGGAVPALHVAISSSGDFVGDGLTCDQAVVRTSSSGDAHVRVTGRLDARCSSSGDVIYYGNPDVNSRESSSGDIYRAGG